MKKEQTHRQWESLIQHEVISIDQGKALVKVDKTTAAILQNTFEAWRYLYASIAEEEQVSDVAITLDDVMGPLTEQFTITNIGN